MADNTYIPEDFMQSFIDSDKYFPTDLQKFQFFNKYSRYNHDAGRRETWHETVTRSVDFLRELSDNKLNEDIYKEIKDSILNMEVMPSMRLLAMAGPAARRNNISLYNCSFLGVDSIDAFVEALIISMSGCGVGYSVENQFVRNLPLVKNQQKSPPLPYTVEDSAEGWADALRYGLTAWFAGGDVIFDFSKIRPRGAVLRTKGGQASGPTPLRKLLQFSRNTILSRQGTKLSTLDAHDIMCVVGDAAVSGGHRRTAMIALFDYDDSLMLNCKSGSFWIDHPYRSNANNSAVWPENITNEQIETQMRHMFNDMNGEPGIFSRANALRTKPDRRKDAIFGTNPCITGDTWIHTSDGPQQAKDLVGKAFLAYVHGALFPSTDDGFWSNGIKPVLKVTTDDGRFIKLTDNHKLYSNGRWVEAKNIKIGDKVSLHNHHGKEWGEYLKFESGYQDGIYKIENGESLSSSNYHRGYISGFFESYGIIVKDENKGTSIVAKEYRQDYLLFIQRLLGRLGINSRVYLHSNCPDDLSIYEISITGDNLWLLFNSVNFPNLLPGKEKVDIYMENISKKQKREKFEAKVVSIENAGLEEVYDCSIPGVNFYDANGFVSHNCGEINLRNMQFCNLSAVIARHNDTAITLAQKVRIATIIGTIQSTATYFPGLRPQWQINCEEERLLGVDITGQMDSPVARDAGVKESLREYAIRINQEYAKILNINPSSSITCVKPSGNTSVLVDCSSGLHARHSEYYIRNVRLEASSPLSTVMEWADVPMYPENGQGTVKNPEISTWVIPFPVASPEGAITKASLSAIDQCEFWLSNKISWTEHNPSVTISYHPQELDDLIKWVCKHKELIGGMSFFPISGAIYKQMPYEAITREEYEKRKSEFPPIDFSRLYFYEHSDTTTASQEVACSSGFCELII